MGSIGVVCVVIGLVGAGLLRWLPARGRAVGLTAVGVAGVRGGSKAALTVAVVELHLAGAIEVGRPGRLRRVVHTSPGRDVTALNRAAWTVFGREISLADAAIAPAVWRAREELRAELAERGLRCGRARLAVAGLLILATGSTAVAVAVQGSPWAGLPPAVLSLAVLCAPVRTLAGHRLLREMRRLHPLPGDTPAGPEEIGLLVALHGRRALRLLGPEFAVRAGLLGDRAARETVARTEGDSYGHSALSGDGSL
ncbi:TIGR04222 domain-containing membrane protein [Streptomyces sp. NBC_00503]|uniref:TIGR04222 domain-containing membrane protein n=1 Tax=Streptomyces sp. NBC_00503 TaxID=2903659 RepID=UPI002E8175B2|nr:TIGR04222 domain-containing membrane protein [Streptomyces sp. NBC_00503]WUD85468.1 TIGR04222 domain-containing membrane protein [Streptomyces sp. NBC_00503]